MLQFRFLIQLIVHRMRLESLCIYEFDMSSFSSVLVLILPILIQSGFFLIISSLGILFQNL